MSNLSFDDVKKLAVLSALELDDSEVEKLQPELDAILGYFEQLKEVDTTGVEPTYQVNGLESVVREDEIIDYGVKQSDMLKPSPEVKGQQIVVPRVVE